MGQGAQRTGATTHVLLAIDSFKGSATSAEAEAWVREGVLSACPEAVVEALPLADGGEGTVAALHAACDGELCAAQVHDPFGNIIEARYLFCASASAPWAVVEMAEAAGIRFSDCSEESALAASTYGVGELMMTAIERGATKLYIGLGGSATNDGGAGMLAALGAKLSFDEGEDPGHLPSLSSLQHLKSIDLQPAQDALKGAELQILSDVTNPLVGPNGALAVFGKQKGIPTEDKAKLTQYEHWLTTYAQHLEDGKGVRLVFHKLTPHTGTASEFGEGASPLFRISGGGAAGGLGAALLALGARMGSGIEAVLDLAGFDEKLARADLVITGEGHMDAQTAGGKAPVGVAQRAKRAGKPVYAVVGACDDDLSAVYEQGICKVFPAVEGRAVTPQDLTAEATKANLRCLGAKAIEAFLGA